MEIQQIADTCVYTIQHSDKLGFQFRLDGKGEFTTGQSWATAKKSFDVAKRNGLKMLVVFGTADGDKSDNLLYYAVLDSVELIENKSGKKSTKYSYSGLTRYDVPKTSLIVANSGEHLPEDFIRAYSICRTPENIFN